MTVYAVPGYEPEDLAQEARLALFQAGDPVGPLATVVIQRRLISLLRSATRERQRALNDSVRRHDEHAALDLLPGGRDPADVVCARDELRRRGETLTPSERRALVYVVAGIPYERDRRVDNAVTRARRKLRAAA
jgi:DNA-directed RNA polymerase specialized sigma24 family protein